MLISIASAPIRSTFEARYAISDAEEPHMEHISLQSRFLTCSSSHSHCSKCRSEYSIVLNMRYPSTNTRGETRCFASNVIVSVITAPAPASMQRWIDLPSRAQGPAAVITGFLSGIPIRSIGFNIAITSFPPSGSECEWFMLSLQCSFQT
ncbi:hypothetical protein SDC9_170788 [bioreactor metagenome]|uniref:Uncharacterized protein n=1 Tax=bioreactor metagenome TaxID=1076179 RepID=A0A645GBH4_9ZZZZ